MAKTILVYHISFGGYIKTNRYWQKNISISATDTICIGISVQPYSLHAYTGCVGAVCKLTNTPILCVGRGKRLLETSLMVAAGIVTSHLVASSSCLERLFLRRPFPVTKLLACLIQQSNFLRTATLPFLSQRELRISILKIYSHC